MYAQNSPPPPVLYLLPGTGGDARLFTYTHVHGWETRVLELPVLPAGGTLPLMAQMLLPQVDTSGVYAFAGVSLGGMVAVELGKVSQPAAVLLIASAKTRSELPFHYRMQRYVPIYKAFKGSSYLKMTNFGRPWFEPEGRPWDDLFKSMIDAKDPLFIPRALDAIMTWNNETIPANTFHLHGQRDRTLPARNIRYAEILPKGSHMIVVTRAAEVNTWLQERLDGALAMQASSK